MTVSGLSVGKVAAIDFLPGSEKILVSFTLRNDLAFSKNSAAELYEAGLIGGKSIAILPVYDGAAAMQDGDTLRGDNQTWFNRCGQSTNRATTTKTRNSAG